VKRNLILIVICCILSLVIVPSVSGQPKEDGLKVFEKAERIRKSAETEEDLRKAGGKYKEALKLLERSENRPTLCNATERLGDLYLKLRENDKARACFQKSLSLSRDLKDRPAEGRNLYFLALLARNEGRFQEAVSFCKQSLAIRKQLPDLYACVQTLWELGHAYQSLGEFEQSSKAFLEFLLLMGEGLQDRT
jgi:tetratricopeptide (TPR) repeat protein